MAMNPPNPAAEQATNRVAGLVDLIQIYEQEAEAYASCSDDSEDIIVVHDSRGCLMDLDVRDGLQRELTTDEFNDRVSEAMQSNAARAAKGFDDICERFFAGAAKLASPETLKHPVAEDMANAFNNTKSQRKQ
ncbi:MAG: hypothetical protein K0U78_21220 [Actinomycetia bacterium]|nr:hypothetical protein [Actinomycetes bacterium]